MSFKKVARIIQKNNGWKNIMGVLLVFVSLEAIFTIVLLPKFTEVTGQPILDMQLLNSFEMTYQMIDDYGKEGMKLYQYIQLVDLLFPLSYGLLFSMLISKFTLTRNKCMSYVILFPLIAPVFDYLENIGIYMMFQLHPGKYLLLAQITAFLTVLKFSFLGVTIVLLFWILIKWFLNNKN